MAREKLGALLILMFSIAYGVLTFQIPLTFLAEQEMFNSRTMPMALAVIGIVISLLIIILPTVDEAGKPSIREVTNGMEFKKAFALIGIMIAYGLIMKWVGFLLASVIFLMAGFRILGETRKRVMIIASIPLVFVLWVIMSLLLGVYIAPGELFYILGIINV